MFDGLVVPVRKGEPRPEGFVLEKGFYGGHRVRRRARGLLEARRQRPRHPGGETDGGQVDVVVVPGESEVYVDELAVGYRLAGTVEVARDAQGAREVIRGAER